MPRIAGINIPENKQIRIALTYIYGIGLPLADKILKQVKIDPYVRSSDLNSEEINKLRDIIEKEYKIEGDLRRDIMVSVKRLRDIGCWRGMRHIKGLPVRGQRTKSNFRRNKGKSLGVQKKKGK